LKNWKANGKKGDKEMQRKKSIADDEDDFSQRFGDLITASSEKRR
jgi:hypothetical protein